MLQLEVSLEKVVVVIPWIQRLLKLTFLSFVSQLPGGIIQLLPCLKEKTLERSSCAVNRVDPMQDAAHVIRAAPPVDLACIFPVSGEKKVIPPRSPLDLVSVPHVVLTDSPHIRALVVQDRRSLVESVPFSRGRNLAPRLRTHIMCIVSFAKSITRNGV